MNDMNELLHLREENDKLREELQALREKLPGAAEQPPAPSSLVSEPTSAAAFSPSHTLSKDQVQRYSRQLLLHSFGLEAQQAVCRASVLIIGCGGLGSPAALYLAAMGIGKLGLVDHDVVELSNLHRQIIHSESKVGMHKALSAQASCQAMNSSVQLQVYTAGLTAANALDIVKQYDVIVDCSDNPPTRYLISDACVVADKPLVSAAAVGTDGQLTVYNYGPDGPCYRCLFPESPAPENCSRCSDAGVLGVVPGIMGCLQALETIKIISGQGEVLSKRMLIFDALSGRFMTVKLRAQSTSCAACGSQPSVTSSSLHAYDYVAFTGQEAQDGPPTPLTLIPEAERLQPTQAKEVIDEAQRSGSSVMLLDVRPLLQFKLMHLPGAVSLPIEELAGRMDEVLNLYSQCSSSSSSKASGVDNSATGPAFSSSAPVIVICRRGNASQLAVQALRQAGLGHAVDIVGGMTRWAREVDNTLPIL